MKLIIKAVIEKISTRVDGSVTIKLSTPELNDKQAGKLLGLRNKVTFVGMNDKEIQVDEINTLGKGLKATSPIKKSNSQRLRSILYVYWQKAGATGLFDDFYDREMERIMTFYKSKI